MKDYISQHKQIMLHGDPIECIKIKTSSNRFFPEIDHSGSSARITLEQNKFGKKVTANRDRKW